jgi:hypothetical protein
MHLYHNKALTALSRNTEQLLRVLRNKLQAVETKALRKHLTASTKLCYALCQQSESRRQHKVIIPIRCTHCGSSNTYAKTSKQEKVLDDGGQLVTAMCHRCRRCGKEFFRVFQDMQAITEPQSLSVKEILKDPDKRKDLLEGLFPSKKKEEEPTK